MTTNSTGTTNMANDEAAIIPPITVTPMVLRATAPAPVASTRGNTPKMNARDVMIMGRKRKLTASIVDWRLIYLAEFELNNLFGS